ncbi:murein hydrolase activator EnvC family protein [Actinobacillus delphinicola]|uniref:Peptidase M23B n=1 Tax=Actinobacillus delphinicola TaxID=51161 RepID=A0A448TU38_9PAST|nr:peptidoglycan DD-metalloendopeptidase family protein [Actinobacillus delphinicola]VEJ09435.1 peptidase M23B [Actinobacillus delphinicola]
MRKNYLWWLALCLPMMGQASELSNLQTQIAKQQDKVRLQEQTQKSLQQEVKDFHKTLQALTGQVEDLKESLQKTQQRQKDLQLKQQKLKVTFSQQKDQLQDIVTTIYKAKLDPSFLEELLSDPNKHTEILKNYFTYLYQQKAKLLSSLESTQHLLLGQQQQLLDQTNAINQQKNDLQKALDQKKETEKNYQDSLSKLRRQLSQERRKLMQLRANEKALRDKIAEAERQAAAQVLQAQQKALLAKAQKGLGRPHHQYAYPVQSLGILHQFGTSQLEELRWRGVVFKANRGAPVRAIYTGQVIFAGKLSGYGLMVILKHGKNDLTLYGYNQALLVKTGDVVSTGQEIAKVGTISGQEQAGLYFEISRYGEGVNPLSFLK